MGERTGYSGVLGAQVRQRVMDGEVKQEKELLGWRPTAEAVGIKVVVHEDGKTYHVEVA